MRDGVEQSSGHVFCTSYWMGHQGVQQKKKSKKKSKKAPPTRSVRGSEGQREGERNTPMACADEQDAGPKPALLFSPSVVSAGTFVILRSPS